MLGRLLFRLCHLSHSCFKCCAKSRASWLTGRLKDTREEKGSEAERAIGCRVVTCSASRSKNPLRVTVCQGSVYLEATTASGCCFFWLQLPQPMWVLEFSQQVERTAGCSAVMHQLCNWRLDKYSNAVPHNANEWHLMKYKLMKMSISRRILSGLVSCLSA